MSVFSISDLHLPIGVKKPMEIFGQRWENYVEKIEKNWIDTITDDDYIIIPGDISWATYLDEAVPDLKFINSLPGTKIISKGNHDYWWPTLNKLDELKERENLSKLVFLHNNFYTFGNYTVCACRGWLTPEDKKFSGEDEKIYRRELIREELSLKAAKESGAENIILAIHYPPLSGFYEVAEKYDVRKIVYGHLHHETQGNYHEISQLTSLVACDYLRFLPEKIIE